MALSLTRVGRPTTTGHHKAGFWDATPDTSYPTGGWSLTASDLGLPSSVVWVTPSNVGGYVFSYDYTNSKLLAYRQSAATGALTEVPNATNISAIGAVRLKYEGF